jgi:hypothetical protein
MHRLQGMRSRVGGAVAWAARAVVTARVAVATGVALIGGSPIAWVRGGMHFRGMMEGFLCMQHFTACVSNHHVRVCEIWGAFDHVWA